jgi:CHAT domain
MTGPSRADITVNAWQRKGFTRLELSAAKHGVPKQTFRLDGDDRIERALEALDSGLVNLKQALPALEASDDDLRDAYSALRELGSTVRFTLFGNNETVIHRLRDFWRDCMLFASNPQSGPPLIECIADSGMTIPIEYLPLLVSSPPVTASSREELLDQFRAFIGFSCIVQRKVRSPMSAGGMKLTLDPDDRVPMRYLQNDSLRGAYAELQWFSSDMARRVQLEGPYPGAGCSVSLAQQIFDPRVLMDGGQRDLPDQIQHFGCHCYTKAKSPLDSEIELRGEGQDVRARLATIGSDLGELAYISDRRDFDLPLIFLNACGSARMRADGAFSFPQLFLENRNRGFIGTEIEMPDDVAAAFSSSFYERFLKWRKPLGLAMLEARRHLLYGSGNPLGIAYTSYADSDMHV